MCNRRPREQWREIGECGIVLPNRIESFLAVVVSGGGGKPWSVQTRATTTTTTATITSLIKMHQQQQQCRNRNNNQHCSMLNPGY
ncbi:hypothetical protein TYRP_009370 [Tyrophagus putrescentiae]|nr:hypothetical protein TYRP_009370 [Tyrophagus putrescentiae]